MLFIYDHKAQAAKADPFLDQGMGTHDQIGPAVLDFIQNHCFMRRPHSPGQEIHFDAKLFRPVFQVPVVLFCKDLRRGHDRSLMSVLTGRDHGRHGHNRLP